MNEVIPVREGLNVCAVRCNHALPGSAVDLMCPTLNFSLFSFKYNNQSLPHFIDKSIPQYSFVVLHQGVCLEVYREIDLST